MNVPPASDTVADAAGERVKQYVDTGVDACNSVTEKGRAVGRQVNGYVRDNPWMMIGAGVGLGLLLGMLVRRR